MRSELRTRIVLCTLLLFIPHATFGQGQLTPPPGGPAPTMKSLDQVEPRTAITNLPVNISQPGSYYLTQTFAQAFTSTPISITADHVMLDFCGFTVQQTGTSPVDGVSVQKSDNTKDIDNVTVRNGIITGFPSANGIFAFGTRNCVFEDLAITQCSNGISYMTHFPRLVGNVVRHCRLCDNSGSGVNYSGVQGVIEECEALDNAGAGFILSGSSNLIVKCRASGNATNYMIGAVNRGGAIVQPTTNPTAISGLTGGAGSGTSDPYYNLSY